MRILLPSSELNLHTRCENQIENVINRGPIRAGDQMMSDNMRRKYPNATHRPTMPSRRYNCHGLTFAARRTWIWKPSEVSKILNDDDYTQVNLREVLPGDVVVYVQRGDIEHSGIVIANNGFIPLVLSKWGPNHEVIHRVNDCPYDAQEILYYRIMI